MRFDLEINCAGYPVQDNKWFNQLWQRTKFQTNAKEMKLDHNECTMIYLDRVVAFHKTFSVSEASYKDEGEYVWADVPITRDTEPENKDHVIAIFTPNVLGFTSYFKFTDRMSEEDKEYLTRIPKQSVIDLINRFSATSDGEDIEQKTNERGAFKHHNDIILNGKKVLGSEQIRNAYGVYETFMLTLLYEEEIFNNLLKGNPVHESQNREISGLINEGIDIDKRDFLFELAREINKRQELI